MKAAFVLPSNHFWAHKQRERREGRESELDRAPTPDAPARSRRRDHPTKDRTTTEIAPPSRSSPPKTDPPKTDLVLDSKLIDTVILVLVLVLDPKLIDAVVLVLDPKLIGTADLLVSFSSPMTNLVVSISLPMTRLISLFPSVFDHSLPTSLNLTKFFSLMNCFEQIFVSLSVYIEILCNKICLDAEKM